MDTKEKTVLRPIAVLGEAFSAWLSNLVILVLLYSVNIFLLRLLNMSRRIFIESIPSGASGLIYSLVLFVGSLIAIVISSIAALTALFYLFGASRGGRDLLSVKLKELIRCAVIAVKDIFWYLKALLTVWLFAIIVCSVGGLFWLGGQTVYHGNAASAIRLTVLIGASTIFVVLIIAAAWYSFFFSLSPLISVFEKKKLWASIMESRARIRGNALRYLLTLVLYFALYWGLGLGIVFASRNSGQPAQILNFLDPVMAVLFGPLLLSIWLTNYKKLTHSRS